MTVVSLSVAVGGFDAVAAGAAAGGKRERQQHGSDGQADRS